MSAGLVVLALTWLGVGAGAYDCARLTTPDRNYYPMQRVIWAALAFLGMGAGSGALAGHENTTGSRLTFAVVLLLAVLYSDYFIRRRNATARYLPLDLGGQVVFVDRAHLRAQFTTVISLTQHGATPAEWMPELEAAVAEWHRQERGRTALTAAAAARKAAKRAQGRG